MSTDSTVNTTAWGLSVMSAIINEPKNGTMKSNAPTSDKEGSFGFEIAYSDNIFPYAAKKRNECINEKDKS